jgi:DUF4097 and DUF4098 domain-containing protein YvlB
MNRWLIAGVLIVVLIGTIAGVGAVGYLAFRAFVSGNGTFGQSGISAESDQKKVLDVGGTASLVVESSSGKIVVLAGEANKMLVTSHKVAYSSSSEDAEQVLRSMKVDIVQRGNEITIEYKRQNSFSQNGNNRVDFTIAVPKETRIKVDTGLGEVSLNGTQGDASLESGFGAISVSQVQGEVALNTKNGKVDARDIKTGGRPIAVHSDFGAVSMKRVTAGEVNVSTNNGLIELEDVESDGDLKLQSGFGEIRYLGGRAARLFAQTNNGRVALTGLSVKGELNARSGFGALDLTQVNAGEQDLETRNGAISIEEARGKVKAHSDFGKIEVVHGISATMNLTTNNGPVKYSGSLGEGPHILSSGFGPIDLNIPADAALEIDVKTDYGKIKSAIPVTINGDIENTHVIGSIKRGGPRLTATTNNGDIRIGILAPLQAEEKITLGKR